MMASSGRVRRAILFSPGDDRRKIEKGATLGADGVILDLEDGVALNRKEQARAVILEALTTLDFGRSERLVRINTFEENLGMKDLAETIEGRPDAYILPKVESPTQVQRLSSLIGVVEKKHGWPLGGIRILILIETAPAFMYLREIASSDDRLDALIFGGEDLAGSLGATRTRGGQEIAFARAQVVMAAAAFGLEAIDTIWPDLNDLEGLTAHSQEAARMGYSGKMAIHPNQVGPISHAFTPDEQAIAQALRLSQAFEDHQKAGAGVFALDGKMIDMPMLRAAQKVLGKARAAGKLGN
jgi:citrate lyase beta subunit